MSAGRERESDHHYHKVAVLCCAFPFLVVDDVVMNNKGAWREVIVTVSFLVSGVRKRRSGENKRF